MCVWCDSNIDDVVFVDLLNFEKKNPITWQNRSPTEEEEKPCMSQSIDQHNFRSCIGVTWIGDCVPNQWSWSTSVYHCHCSLLHLNHASYYNLKTLFSLVRFAKDICTFSFHIFTNYIHGFHDMDAWHVLCWFMN